MIGKEIIEERDITPSEVKNLLQKRKKEKELTYEQKQSFEYANEFGKIGVQKAKSALKQLEEMERIDTHTAVMIITNMPKEMSDLKILMEKKRFELTDEESKAILDVVAAMEE